MPFTVLVVRIVVMTKAVRKSEYNLTLTAVMGINISVMLKIIIFITNIIKGIAKINL